MNAHDEFNELTILDAFMDLGDGDDVEILVAVRQDTSETIIVLVIGELAFGMSAEQASTTSDLFERAITLFPDRDAVDDAADIALTLRAAIDNIQEAPSQRLN